MDPRAIVEDQDRPLIWVERDAYRRGFEAADASRGSLLHVLLTGVFIGVLVGWMLLGAFLFVGHASAASRSAAEPVIPAASLPASRTVARRPTGAPLGVAGDTTLTTVRPSWRPEVAADGAPTAGVASWYDDGSGLYGAVHSWRFGDRPYKVLVRAGSRSVVVTIRDYCGCPAGRIIDLSPSAFRRLAPLSAGLVRVTVTRLGPTISPPPTDTEEEPR